MRLHVDRKGIVNEFVKVFLKNLSLASLALKQDIDSKKSSKLGGLKNSPEVYIALEKEVDKIRIDIKSNIEFILDNYGTGSLMSLSNPMLSKYKNSSLWNPARSGNNIVGRPKGEYTNILGKHKSSGRFVGKNLENRTIRLSTLGKKLTFKPIAPTNALHYAISWFYKDWFPKCWKKTIKGFNFSKYLTFK